MSDQPTYIVKNKPLPIAQDLEALKARGIEILKKLSGEIWTDYNDHDPGVTVLEQLCYAITELSYKAQFDFEQLFFAKAGGEEYTNLEDYFLLQKAEVFYTNPVTPKDFRKLLLDNADQDLKMKNIWVSSRNLQENSISESASKNKGYLIYLHLSSEEENDIEVARKFANKTFNKYRNFCEYCQAVIPLRHAPINDQLELNVEAINQLSEVVLVASLAQFLFDIKTFLEPTLQFAKSIKNLALDSPFLDEVWHGPHPVKKFIHPATLEATSFERMQLDLELEAFFEQHAGKWNQLISFNDGDLLPERRIKIDGDVPTITTFDEGEFLLRLDEELRSKVRVAYQAKSVPPLLNGEVLWEHFHPQSQLSKKELTDYYSIQYTFPPNYQLGQSDLSVFDGNEQIQIQNLQTYLLLFESLFADFLIKIVCFPEFLKPQLIEGEDINDQEDGFQKSRKQFLELLYTIPGAKSLISDPDSIMKVFDQFSLDLPQKINLRSYALSRYGEEFDTELLQLAWGEPKNFEKAWLQRLGDLMSAYQTYSNAKSTSFNIEEADSDFPLSRKLSILLNQDYQKGQPNVFILERNLIEGQDASFGEVIVTIDIPGLEKNDLNEKRKHAIRTLIEQELPFYLEIRFFFLSDDAESIQINELFQLEGSIELIKRETFLSDYQKWRKDLAERWS